MAQHVSDLYFSIKTRQRLINVKNVLILELKRLKNYCKKNYHSKQRKNLCQNFIIEKAFAI